MYELRLVYGSVRLILTSNSFEPRLQFVIVYTNLFQLEISFLTVICLVYVWNYIFWVPS